eukprot:scaffold138178_cov30-Tisochrysis_lutea.AAC.2
MLYEYSTEYSTLQDNLSQPSSEQRPRGLITSPTIYLRDNRGATSGASPGPWKRVLFSSGSRAPTDTKGGGGGLLSVVVSALLSVLSELCTRARCFCLLFLHLA